MNEYVICQRHNGELVELSTHTTSVEDPIIISQTELWRLHDWQKLVSDLDRNAHGRHAGDVDSGDPTGISQGNPILPPGTHIGWGLFGDRITVPRTEERYNPDAWRP